MRRSPILRTLTRRAEGRLTPALISRAARQGDRASQALWVRVGCELGLGLSSIIHLFNPDRIVIGGGVAGAWPFFSPALLETVRAQTMAVHAMGLHIVRATLGRYAGILGASVLLWNESRSAKKRRGVPADAASFHGMERGA